MLNKYSKAKFCHLKRAFQTFPSISSISITTHPATVPTKAQPSFQIVRLCQSRTHKEGGNTYRRQPPGLIPGSVGLHCEGEIANPMYLTTVSPFFIIWGLRLMWTSEELQVLAQLPV